MIRGSDPPLTRYCRKQIGRATKKKDNEQLCAKCIVLQSMYESQANRKETRRICFTLFHIVSMCFELFLLRPLSLRWDIHTSRVCKYVSQANREPRRSKKLPGSWILGCPPRFRKTCQEYCVLPKIHRIFNKHIAMRTQIFGAGTCFS